MTDTTFDSFTEYELQKARRNRGMPLEALALDVTPVGMHYLLAHFDIPIINPDNWALAIRGEVETELRLSFDDLRRMPQSSQIVTMECAGNGRSLIEPRPEGNAWGYDGVSTARWSGVPLMAILNEAGMRQNAVSVVFTGADYGERLGGTEYYQRALSPFEARSEEMLLALDMGERPLEPQHGAPLRLVAPGWYGMAHVKWLTDIEVTDQDFDGLQHQAYRYKQSEGDSGEPVTKIRVRSLMIPPGYPESSTRHRYVDAGQVMLQGRAWSGTAPIERVDVSVDDVWYEADLQPCSSDARAWQRWTYMWEADLGEHVVASRATDSLGNTQPSEPAWNLRGVGNNAVQQLRVTVK